MPEKALLSYEHVPQPRITDVKLGVELFPREARAVTHGEYVIENRTATPLEHPSTCAGTGTTG